MFLKELAGLGDDPVATGGDAAGDYWVREAGNQAGRVVVGYAGVNADVRLRGPTPGQTITVTAGAVHHHRRLNRNAVASG